MKREGCLYMVLISACSLEMLVMREWSLCILFVSVCFPGILVIESSVSTVSWSVYVV